jgi:hypothetical protein
VSVPGPETDWRRKSDTKVKVRSPIASTGAGTGTNVGAVSTNSARGKPSSTTAAPAPAPVPRNAGGTGKAAFNAGKEQASRQSFSDGNQFNYSDRIKPSGAQRTRQPSNTGAGAGIGAGTASASVMNGSSGGAVKTGKTRAPPPLPSEIVPQGVN